MGRVMLVRHGQTDDNVSGRITGQGQAPLNTRGQEQARLAGDALASLGVTHLVSSPVARARQTADIMNERLQLEIAENADLREVGYGDWEGKHFNNIRNDPLYKVVTQNPLAAVFPNGESLLGVQERAVRVIEGVRRDPNLDVAVLVAHGDTLRTALAHYLGLTFNDYRRINLDNGSISVVDFCGDRSRVKAVNFTPKVGDLDLKAFCETWLKTQTLVT